MTSSERRTAEARLLTARMWTRRTLTLVETQTELAEVETHLLEAWASLERALNALSYSERGFLQTRMFERDISQRAPGL